MSRAEAYVDSGAGRENPPLRKILSLNGLGVTVDIIADYSGGAVYFFTTPPPGEVWRIHKVHFNVSGDGALRADNYRIIAGGLNNGIQLTLRRSQLILDRTLIDSQPIVCNNCLQAFCGSDFLEIDYGAGSKTVSGQLWHGPPFIMIGDNSDRLMVRANDDFTDLDQHRFWASGEIVVGDWY
jgi:hypothetical protein